MTRFVGLDLSLSGAGVAVLEEGLAPRVAVVKSKPTGDGVHARNRRLLAHTLAVRSVIGRSTEPTVVAIERPAYASTSGQVHDRSGFWWMVVDGLISDGYRVAEASPTSLKQFATGKGNASKQDVMWALAKLQIVDAQDDNGADATWLALLAEYAHVILDGTPTAPTTLYRTAAAAKVKWAS